MSYRHSGAMKVSEQEFVWKEVTKYDRKTSGGGE